MTEKIKLKRKRQGEWGGGSLNWFNNKQMNLRCLNKKQWKKHTLLTCKIPLRQYLSFDFHLIAVTSTKPSYSLAFYIGRRNG